MHGKPFNYGANLGVLDLADRIVTCGYAVTDQAPETLPELLAAYERTGQVIVSGDNSGLTIWGTPEINFAFRAWHDFRHITGGHAFTLEGERATCADQLLDIRRNFAEDSRFVALFSAIVTAEVIGQAEHFERFGKFPADQKGFDVAYMADASLALARAW
jgi:hypothetical protein